MRSRRGVRAVERLVEVLALGAVVTAVYVAVVVGVGHAVGTSGQPSRALTLLATIAVAVSFPRVRVRARRLARRLAEGERTTPDEDIADLSRRLAGVLSIDEVLPAVAEAATRITRADRGEARLALAAGDIQVVTHVLRPTPAGEEVVSSVDVVHDGAVVGQLAVTSAMYEGRPPTDARLLGALASQAGIAFATVRLTAELRARLAAISEQAEDLPRLANPADRRDEERQRLERLIRDRVQRELTQATRWLTVASRRAGEDPIAAADAVAKAEGRAERALEALRDLARGVFPALLAERGMVTAIQAYAARDDHLIDVDVDPAIAGTRQPPDIEAAAYFCCVEALRLARAACPGRLVTVSVGHNAHAGGSLELVVAAARPLHGPRPRRGARMAQDGLTVVADRIAALDGSLTVTQPSGGLHVRMLLPAKNEARV